MRPIPKDKEKLEAELLLALRKHSFLHDINIDRADRKKHSYSSQDQIKIYDIMFRNTQRHM